MKNQIDIHRKTKPSSNWSILDWIVSLHVINEELK